jgi:hypothetical protein
MAKVRGSALPAILAAAITAGDTLALTDYDATPKKTYRMTLAQARTAMFSQAGGGYAATDVLSLGNAPPSAGSIRVDGGTITTVSAPVFSAIATWNDAAVTFTGIKVNITNTASAAGSLLLDLQVGGVSLVSISKAGAVTAPVFGTTASNATAVSIKNAAGHNAPYISNVLNFLGSGSADDAAIAAYGAIALYPGNGTTAVLTIASTGIAFTAVNTTITSSITAGSLLTNTTSATTGNLFMQWANTGGGLTFGVESSAGGSIFTGAAAYSTVFGTYAARSLHLVTNGAVRLTIDSAGLTTMNALTVGGAVTLVSLGGGGGAVSVGAADSGGAGFKLLRVPN